MRLWLSFARLRLCVGDPPPPPHFLTAAGSLMVWLCVSYEVRARRGSHVSFFFCQQQWQASGTYPPGYLSTSSCLLRYT